MQPPPFIFPDPPVIGMDLRPALRQRNPAAPPSSLLLDFNRPTTQTPLSPLLLVSLSLKRKTNHHHLVVAVGSSGERTTTGVVVVVVGIGSNGGSRVSAAGLCFSKMTTFQWWLWPEGRCIRVVVSSSDIAFFLNRNGGEEGRLMAAEMTSGQWLTLVFCYSVQSRLSLVQAQLDSLSNSGQAQSTSQLVPDSAGVMFRYSSGFAACSARVLVLLRFRSD
ncbi:hypothetical protein Hanom_Chr13g01207361 [Helianthus anomalus]